MEPLTCSEKPMFFSPFQQTYYFIGCNTQKPAPLTFYACAETEKLCKKILGRYLKKFALLLEKKETMTRPNFTGWDIYIKYDI